MRHVEGEKLNKSNNHDVIPNSVDCFCRNLLISCKMSGFPRNLTGHCVSLSFAFTLAETLIALVVIGIVAALTVPMIMQQHTHKEVETKLQKFYTTMNNSIRRAEIDFGDKKDWYREYEGKPALAKTWFLTYLAPYLNYTKIEENGNTAVVYFADGSSFCFANLSRDIYFFPGNYEKCMKQSNPSGKCVFVFIYSPVREGTDWQWKYHYNKGMEPHKYAWNGTRAQLLTNSTYGCKNGSGSYCTALIQENGWKIPDDYPRKIRL